jgi:hypothetical protein
MEGLASLVLIFGTVHIMHFEKIFCPKEVCKRLAEMLMDKRKLKLQILL